MNIMIASDIHGSAYYCSKLMEAFEREGADRLLLLGDLLYHGPRNDLPRDYAPKEVSTKRNKRFSVSEETAIRKLIRWCWNFRFWPTMPS